MATVCYARSKDPTNRGPYSLQYIYIFRTIFLLINYSLRDPHFIRPEFFYFRDSHLRPTFRDPHFATPIHDPRFTTHISRLPFATHVSRPTFRDSHSRPPLRDPRFATPLATHIRDPRSRLYSRLTFTTRVPDSTRDSRSRLPIAPPTATC